MEVLTPFQKELLRAIGRSSLAENFYLTGADNEPVKVDFAQDTPYRLRPTQPNDSFGIQIDSALDIAANKLAALFDRAAEKDFVDVFFVHRELIDFAELLPLAREKQVGMDNYWLAIAFQRVRQVKLLPRMIKPLILADLQEFFLQLAQDLMTGIDSTAE